MFRPPRLLLYTFFATASEFSRRSIIVITIIICLHQPVKLAKNYSISTATVDSFVKNVRICLNIIQSLKAYCNTHTRAHVRYIGAYIRTHVHTRRMFARAYSLLILTCAQYFIFSRMLTFCLGNRQLYITRSACHASEKHVCFKR